VLLPLRLPAHDEDALAGAEEVDVERRLVAGAVPDEVLLLRPRPALRVLVPVARLAGEADDQQVRPAVAVEVVRPAGEALAVALRVELAVLTDDVRLPVGRLV